MDSLDLSPRVKSSDQHQAKTNYHRARDQLKHMIKHKVRIQKGKA